MVKVSSAAYKAGFSVGTIIRTKNLLENEATELVKETLKDLSKIHQDDLASFLVGKREAFKEAQAA